MACVFITGSTEGLGYAAAADLLGDGHQVVIHARNRRRISAVRDLEDQGAIALVGDLSDPDETRTLAEDVNRLGRMDAVIHNAGIISGPGLLPVNVVAPYLLTTHIEPPERLIYLSSSMHRGGRAEIDGLDWSGQGETCTYSDSKLLVTVLSAAVARLWPDVFSNAVDPGWVPTRMGGPAASDDLQLGHQTQTWLATSDDTEARTTGGYWHHRRRFASHPAVQDPQFQDRLLSALTEHTGVHLTAR
ncbi:SDR family NAD(P)-dependent oxidoreductase [Arhodomonas aquaeolei]|uniref:SDR family NAD(P)-dependent oxidoreductase n=1 Tax=Arhodomonas aquaeolei TaxID=2369 RepID=UPI000376D522|nr:SDR family NAD(P)-dependent oxidoreductase [Arhodomonas aquaeolei]